MTTRRISRGFTLVELIAVMIILGILAAVAVPRFMSRSTFDTLSFFDQAKSALRYAQKTAIAQRRNVFVNVTANAICLTYAADPSCSSSDPANHVLNPANRAWFRLAAPGNVSFTTAGSFYFSPLGKPLIPGTPPIETTITGGISGDGMVRSITVERETGHVY